jgi:hypothetical protein
MSGPTRGEVLHYLDSARLVYTAVAREVLSSLSDLSLSLLTLQCVGNRKSRLHTRLLYY